MAIYNFCLSLDQHAEKEGEQRCVKRGGEEEEKRDGKRGTREEGAELYRDGEGETWRVQRPRGGRKNERRRRN